MIWLWIGYMVIATFFAMIGARMAEQDGTVPRWAVGATGVIGGLLWPVVLIAGLVAFLRRKNESR